MEWFYKLLWSIMWFIVVYVTHANQEDAKRIGDLLLAKKVIACYNIVPIEAVYRRKWDIAHEDEIVTLLKAPTEHRKMIQILLKEHHPYEIPCIMKINVEANKEYEDWIKKETKFIE